MRIDGLAEALILLRGLNPAEQRVLIEEMKKKDPRIAEFLAAKLISIEDLKKLTPKMLQRFLQGLDYRKLGLALRGTSEELISFIQSSVSSGIKREIDDVLNGPPQPRSKVTEAQQEMIDKLSKGIDKGHYALSDDGETYV